ncbi:hypothetical protein CVT26_003830 [Gymnopilus dilepis]|uniref:Uncharacterized protein n=1 Tax=Gymnopilus dilepis TaxID=231916 RepID=A0A409YV17_9AGAR|nr:hypothetical protein CVT26_003830 [Gymnopilus dilepis]
MDTPVIDGSPPPAYTPLQPTEAPAITEEPHSFSPPSSPSLEELETEFFGRPLSVVPAQSTRVPSVLNVLDTLDTADGRVPPHPSRDVQSSRQAAPLQPVPSQDVHVTPAESQPPAKRARKRKGPQDGADSETSTPAPAPVFELLIEVLQPEKKVRSGPGRAKTVKVDPLKFGPLNVSSDIAWDDFLEAVSKQVATTAPNLAVSTFCWRFLVPKNSPSLPLTGDAGHLSFLGQVRAKIAKSGSAYVILSMQPPVVAKSQLPVSLPFILQLPTYKSIQPWALAAPGQAALAVSADANESSDDDDPTRKKARLDDDVEVLASQIEEKYPAGICSLHPNIPCFHHKVNDLHFDLSLRPRRLVWAAAIRKGTARIDQIPLGTNFFKAEHALKSVKGGQPAASSTASESIEPLTTPARPKEQPAPLAPAHPTPFGALHPPPHPGYPGYYPHPYMPPTPFYPPYHFDHSHIHGRQGIPPVGTPTRASRSHRAIEDLRSSSPPIPDFDLDDFCDVYHLNAKARQALEDLGFTGDSLEQVPEAEWRKLGLGFLEWQRIVKAAKKYRKDLRK